MIRKTWFRSNLDLRFFGLGSWVRRCISFQPIAVLYMILDMLVKADPSWSLSLLPVRTWWNPIYMDDGTAQGRWFYSEVKDRLHQQGTFSRIGYVLGMKDASVGYSDTSHCFRHVGWTISAPSSMLHAVENAHYLSTFYGLVREKSMISDDPTSSTDCWEGRRSNFCPRKEPDLPLRFTIW